MCPPCEPTWSHDRPARRGRAHGEHKCRVTLNRKTYRGLATRGIRETLRNRRAAAPRAAQKDVILRRPSAPAPWKRVPRLARESKVEHFGTFLRFSTDFRELDDASMEHSGTFRNISAPRPAHSGTFGCVRMQRPRDLTPGIAVPLFAPQADEPDCQRIRVVPRHGALSSIDRFHWKPICVCTRGRTDDRATTWASQQKNPRERLGVFCHATAERAG
jgi:hypothetical protein